MQEELRQKDKELELKEKEIDLQRQKDSVEALKNAPSNLADIYESVKRSVFLIYTADDINVSQGSAFVINPNGDAISNYHVFENASKAIAINADGKRFMIDKIYTYNKDKDYIIFRIGPNYSGFTSAKIALNKSRVGEECFAIGNPRGLTQSLSTGIISGYRDNDRMIQTTAEITHGSSGGPLFNKNGEVIGITTSGLGEANLNFALSIDELPIDNYLANTTAPVISNDISSTERESAQSAIQGYFSALKYSDYERVKLYLTETLDRFYTSYNISREDVVLSDYNYKSSKGISVKDISINWSTFSMYKLGYGYSLTFNMEYSITRNDSYKPTVFNLQMNLELTPSFKIRSIYENIVSKY